MDGLEKRAWAETVERRLSAEDVGHKVVEVVAAEEDTGQPDHFEKLRGKYQNPFTD